jgi:hypothetical protein
MTKDYITEYSYGLAESFNLIAPRLLVGQTMSHWVKTVKCMSLCLGGVPEGQAADYVKRNQLIGDQPIVAAPAYIGIVVFFGNYSFVY